MRIKTIRKNPEKKITVDIEVSGTHTYQLKNGAVVHNTTSLVVGSSSGIHAWHNDYYVRTIRVGKNEAVYGYLQQAHPELLEDDFFAPHKTAVISVPQKAPKGAILRNESALDLLERVGKVWKEWVKVGHRKGANINNVSTTVSIKKDEWQDVFEWMWANRENYTALSVLPHDDHTYIQAPFQDITKERYEELFAHLHTLDLTKVIETEDETELQQTVACSGGACEIV
jgi:ribonucleoside-diphosphate reductase alpha chain